MERVAAESELDVGDRSFSELSASTPLLRPGVLVHIEPAQIDASPENSRCYIGFSHRGIFIDIKPGATESSEHPGQLGHLELLRYLKAQSHHQSSPTFQPFSINQLASLTNLENSAILKFFTPLQREHLLVFQFPTDTKRSNIGFDARVVAENNIAHLFAENSASSWNSTLEIRKRSELSIALLHAQIQTSPLLTSLYSLLLAAGFTSTHLHLTGKARRTTPAEVHGLALNTNDVGITEKDLITRIRTRSSLFYERSRENSLLFTTPSLVICAGIPDLYQSQQWLSAGIAHLAISPLEEGRITIGPLVIPGKSACLNCVAIANREAHPLAPLLDLARTQCADVEIPGSLIAIIAGTITACISEFAATGGSELIGRSVTYDARRICNPEHKLWSRSSLCGCSGPV